ncbi:MULTISPECIES: TetR/AcrR family transcriptional regulator [unclassified Methylobacterium]|uniref:TetR/AcrR family transcriptional regulator n=1 Tax=unclassified Methylobacterium TaxID=2615210 RepID=UPI0011C75A8B|nr:TetR/AcrR family transcriptional regulator [Methylobacterium sp. WL64]TXN02056.1 TetR/AcrR family transcriptional regulator [Methylobacterium sp. WL64]
MARSPKPKSGPAGPLTASRPPQNPAERGQTGSRRRLSPIDREKSIAAAAVAFFAERGFEGQTRELATILGITQPLLYRYFPSKEALIERVYQDVFVGRWDPFWEETIKDRSVPLETRLTKFYISYANVILTPEWVRLFMFAGLKNLDFNARYLNFLRDRVFESVVEELRTHFDRPSIRDVPASNIEIEIVWSIHSSIFYLGVREFIYRLPPDGNIKDIIQAKIQTLLGGVATVLPSAEHAT